MSDSRPAHPRRFHRARLVLGVGMAVVPSLGCLAGGSAPGGAGEETAPPPAVEAVQSRRGRLPLEERVSGVVRAENQVAVRPEIEGRVAEVLVRSGDTVRRGQPLVRLDESLLRDQLRQAEASVRLEEASAKGARARVAELRAQASRARELASQELISRLTLETIEAQLDAAQAAADEGEARVEQARATVEERRSALDKTIVRSPVVGRVGDRRVEVGMLVDPATILFLAGDLRALIVEVNLTEMMLARGVEPGLKVLVETHGDGREPVRAELSRISPFLAEQSFTALGEIDVQNRDGRLRPGMFATVRILVGESREATLVPVSAIWEDPASGERGVFVVEETSGLETPRGAAGEVPSAARAVAFRPLEIVAEGRGAAGVEGLDDGAWVVTLGQHLLGGELWAGGTDETARTARVRPVAWERVVELQDLQDEDLLEGFLDKQRKLAAALGSEIPASEEVVERVLAEAAASKPAGE